MDDAWQEHFTPDRWEAIKKDPDFPLQELLRFYQVSGNQELPVIQSVIHLIKSEISTRNQSI